ncbi:hypothetical protein Tco_1490299, partial [Tanacetum coccineum]
FMCVESWSRGSFARALIELDATCGLKEIKAQPKDEKQKDVPDDDFQSVKQKTRKCGNCEIQGKRQGIGFNKPSNGSYRPVVKPQSNTSVSDMFSSLKEDNGSSIEDLVDDTLKKVEVHPKKNGIWSAKKAKRNIAFSPETKLHYFNRDLLEFANMNQMVEEAKHGNVPSKHG